MSYILSLYEVIEIRELLSFKKTSLAKSRSFYITVKDQHRTGSLEDDIELSIREIDDLKNMLLVSN